MENLWMYWKRSQHQFFISKKYRFNFLDDSDTTFARHPPGSIVARTCLKVSSGFIYVGGGRTQFLYRFVESAHAANSVHVSYSTVFEIHAQSFYKRIVSIYRVLFCT